MSIKRSATLALAIVALTYNAQAQGGLKGLINTTKKAVGGGTLPGGNKGGSLTNNEIISGLKEALNVGTRNATGRVSAVNGFLGNSVIKILMPPEAKKIETTLRAMGMGAQVDRAIVSMNRAAEDASGKAVPIFVNAITGITIQDGLSILKGNNDAATQYLRGRTTAELTTAFRPTIQAALNKANATRYWTEIVTIYNRLPTTRQKMNPDLVAYVTERALNGIFVNIAQEEAQIRTNPAARVTDILRKVFGG